MHALRALRNALLSPGRRLFGLRFSFGYLRFALRAARQWGDTGSGRLELLGFHLDYPNQSHALFLLHEIFVNAEYDFDTSNPRPRIVDCGANIGTAVLFFKARWRDAEIIAFEPDPATFARLVRTIESNGLGGVQAVHAAVGATEGTVAFYTNPSDPGSLTSSVDPAWGGEVLQDVPAVRLSSRISAPVDFLKLDVEGAEYDVIDDLIDTGAIRWVREAAVEYHHLASRPGALAAMKAALESAGFDVTETTLGAGGQVGMLRARRR